MVYPCTFTVSLSDQQLATGFLNKDQIKMLDKNVIFYLILIQCPAPNMSVQINSNPPTNIVVDL